jgi:uncharacterized protein
MKSATSPGSDLTGPLLTAKNHDQLSRARRAGESRLICSLDLDRSTTEIELRTEHWFWQEQEFPYLDKCKDRTVYHWDGSSFEPVARFHESLIKLVPTPWGPPTFEIDGIKMLPTAQLSPYADAANKVRLIQPRGKRILDTCGGLGYFAAWCQQGGAAQVQSFEKNPDVIWLRSLNPWSPRTDEVLSLTLGDISEQIQTLDSASFDAALHDPPRFGIAGELYSQAFYDHLARVLKPGGKLFHYTGSPNKLTSSRDVPKEVAGRLRVAGFAAELSGDGVLATKHVG